MKQILVKTAILFVLLGILSGCKAITLPEPESPAERTWTPSEYAMTFGDTDPWEGFNRAMFEIDRFCILYAVRPFGWVWAGILPAMAIECLDRAAENLNFPARTVSCMLQKRWKDAGIDFSRFLINTTIGIAGLFDPADAWFDLYPREEDFGQAFTSMGYGPGYTLVLPFVSASNVRDTLGFGFDCIFDLKSYCTIGLPVYGVQFICGMNKLVMDFRLTEEGLLAYADPYQLYKETMLLRRQLLQENWYLKLRIMHAKAQKQPFSAAELSPAPATEQIVTPRPDGIEGKIVHLPDYRPENPWSDSVRVLKMQPQTNNSSIWSHLSPWNGDFCNKAELRSIDPVRKGADALRYRFWRAQDPDKYNHAPLAVLFPGIGGHYTNHTAMALAELLNRNGFAVVLLSSVYCHDFYASRCTGQVPGYTPQDAEDLRQTVAEILKDLQTGIFKSRRFEAESISLAGYSMGGLHALHIAALEEKSPLLHLKKVVAVNPPADLLYALNEVDRCRQSYKGSAPERISNEVPDGFAKALLGGRQVLPWRPRLEEQRKQHPSPVDGEAYVAQLTRKQAEYLAALSFGYTLRDIMMIACRDGRLKQETCLGYRKNGRTAFYAQIDSMGFAGYMRNFVMPACRNDLHRDFTEAELADITGLHGIESTLRENRRVFILHNLNDFLISDEDKRFLDRTLGDRITWFDQGGHLGNLYDGHWQHELLQKLQ